MRGGYLADRFVLGAEYSEDDGFRLYDWDVIDVFVYFSHHLVTIPPQGWIDVAHRHGCRVLGTFITEWDKGAATCQELFEDTATADVAVANLTRIAADHCFDGWLINIENKASTRECTEVHD
ncbi:cytosolic endo-beta-N-acetylglucosaminidase-like protein [Tribonema minus]|uniref:Cytosolic endo-beta-N-acetylglucosaminidase-like protein n=1 Tax=Tribonema minus TaxID=303371 RepID=A0A836CIV1_9STRA|nr:cytosolic endo-beta-N-acetylglucosaminidase-like protein [Tribonema minus]